MQVPDQAQQDSQGSRPAEGLVHAVAAQEPDRLQPLSRNSVLTQFRGDKQHDANDFLVNFLNTINDHLTKPEEKAYHPVL